MWCSEHEHDMVRRQSVHLIAAVGVASLAVVAVSAPAVAAQSAQRPGGAGLTLGAAVLLGIVEGLTEWLPISSTGHLTVTQSLLGIEGAAATSYAIAIQAGAILAVLGLYRHRFTAMFQGLTGRDAHGRRLLQVVVVACVPAAVTGLLLEDVIKSRLFGPWPVVAAWFVGGVVILVLGSRWKHRQEAGAGQPLSALTVRSALLIGVVQTLALWPGVSRSLVTILAATAVGLAIPAAVEFSFLLGFVVLGGATLYEAAASGGDLVAAYGVAAPLLGLAVAFVAAVLAMRWLVSYLASHGLAIFGWYRITIAAVVAAMLLTGVI